MINLHLSIFQDIPKHHYFIQRVLFESLFDESLSSDIIEKIDLNDLSWRPLLFRQQVLSLMRLCLEYCPIEGGLDLSIKPKGRAEIGQAALMVSDILLSTEKEEELLQLEKLGVNNHLVTEELAAQMLLGMELNNPQDTFASFARTKEYLKIYKSRPGDHDYIFLDKRSLHDKFKEITGFDIENYLDFITILALQFKEILGENRPIDLIESPALINVGAIEFFSQIPLFKDQADLLFRHRALSIPDLIQKIKSHETKFKLSKYRDFTIFRKYPLVFTGSSQQVLTCLDASFLGELTGNGFYHLIHEELKAREDLSELDRKNLRRFMSSWGKAFEAYINDRLKSAGQSNRLKAFYPNPNFTSDDKEAFDIALNYGPDLIVIEAKAKFVRLDVKASDDRKNLISALEEMDLVGEAIKQLLKNIERIFGDANNEDKRIFASISGGLSQVFNARQRKRVNRIYPVIVHQEFFLRFDLVDRIARTMFEDQLSNHKIEKRLLKPLILLTVEDIETLIPYLKTLHLPNILKKFISGDKRHSTFGAFFSWYLEKNKIKKISDTFAIKHLNALHQAINSEATD